MAVIVQRFAIPIHRVINNDIRRSKSTVYSALNDLRSIELLLEHIHLFWMRRVEDEVWSRGPSHVNRTSQQHRRATN